MKATYSSDRNGGSVINVIFADSERDKAEEICKSIIEEEDFEWISEEEDMFTIGSASECLTIAEMRKIWKESKKALS